MGKKNHLKAMVNKLPDVPGVYFFKNKGNVIYIGKAVSLKKRVRSYFSSSAKPFRISHLIEHIDDIEFTVTDSEESALVLERDLVREYLPKYNVDLKDDKAFPYLKLTLKEDFPRLILVRRKQDDGAKYYGPFTKVKDLKIFLRFINQLFPLRTCRERLKDKKPCLNYFIKHCIGPCRGEINSRIYKELVSNIDKILKGNFKNIIKDLENKMNIAAREERFEDAVQFRDYLFSLRKLIERRRVLVSGKINGDKYQKNDIKKKNDAISKKLSKSLHLKKIAKVIEAFDISNIAGANSCGSLVFFKDGIAVPQEYRRFKIKTIEGIDDPGMIAEVVYRRYKRRLEEKTGLPDMILVDGGLTQVNAAHSRLKDLQIAYIPIFGIVKKKEVLYRPFKNIPIKLRFDSEELNYLRRIRDEAHRFALRYHRLRRKKSFLPPS